MQLLLCGTADDSFLASDTSDANGNYLFTGLPSGIYCADPDETTLPAGYTLSSNNDPQRIDLGPGQDDLEADFGYQPPRFSLGDRVWYDQNQNGVQDAAEPGYNGVNVDLYGNATCSGCLRCLVTQSLESWGLTPYKPFGHDVF